MTSRRNETASRFSRPPRAFGAHWPSAARVVEVEHGRDRVDPQPVDVELLQPVDRVRDQEVADLAPAVVEDERAPVRVRAAPRVGVLVQRRAVEAGQRPLVAGEVGGHPVDDDADPGLVQPVHQVAELIRRAEPGRRRVVRGHLVAPGAAERVLGDRQELHVREAEVGDVGGELVGELGVGEPGAPRAQVHLVGAHRPARAGRAAARAAIQAWSPQSYRDSETTDAVAGGRSASAAIGSALRCQLPSGPRMSYL